MLDPNSQGEGEFERVPDANHYFEIFFHGASNVAMEVKGRRKLVLLQDIGSGSVTVSVRYPPAKSIHGRTQIRVWEIRV